jgi:hypothetical protein
MAKSVEQLKRITHPPATLVTVEDMHTAVAAAIQADWRQAFGDMQQAAIEFRNALLDRPWPDAARVVALLGARIEPGGATAYVARLCARRALLGVWSERDQAFRYPDFQFDARGQLRPRLAALLANLPGGAEDRGGWRWAFWLYSPHARLDGQVPAEVFVSNPERVIDVSRQEFKGDRNASW